MILDEYGVRVRQRLRPRSNFYRFVRETLGSMRPDPLPLETSYE